MGQVGLEWSIAGFGDFSTRANETDMLMRNSNTGAFEVYDIVNNTITSCAPMGQVGLEWTIAGFGDFSGNANETDMLMRNSNTGVFELYDITNNTITSVTPVRPGRPGMVDHRRIGHSDERAARHAAQWRRRRPGRCVARPAHAGDGVVRARAPARPRRPRRSIKRR